MSEYAELQSLVRSKINGLVAKLPNYPRAVVEQWWRLNNLYWIENENGKKVKFRATPVQTKLFFNLHRRNVVPKARQVRVSTLMALMALDHCLFGANKTAGIIDLTDEDAKRKLARVKFAYDHLDDPDDPVTAALGGIVKKWAPLTKRNEHELGWANESKFWASTTLRGGTITFLWVTEFGPIASQFPDKAAKIKSGALNTIHQEAFACIESTYKGGRFGAFYELIRLAQRSPRNLDVMQWRHHFFGWQDEPTYQRPAPDALFINGKYADYFDELEKAIGRKLTPEQKNWYMLKAEEQGDEMACEFPGTVEEALRGRVDGSIYGDIMVRLRAQGRVSDFVAAPGVPMFTSWDIGDSDYTCVWLLQFIGFDIHALAYHCGHAMTPAQHVAEVLKWEKRYGLPIAAHFVPHDAGATHNGSTHIDHCKAAGLRDIKRVPVIRSTWDGINALRGLLPRFRFHSECDKDIERGDHIYPSGIGCLEAYKRKVAAVDGRIIEEPVHDEASHGASALRTIAEAHMRKMLVHVPALANEQRTPVASQATAIGGIRRADAALSGPQALSALR